MAPVGRHIRLGSSFVPACITCVIQSQVSPDIVTSARRHAEMVSRYLLMPSHAVNGIGRRTGPAFPA